MNLASIRKNAFAMPVYNLASPRPPYRFINREYLIISYETDFDALRAIVPDPSQLRDNLLHYELIREPGLVGIRFSMPKAVRSSRCVTSNDASADTRIRCTWMTKVRLPVAAKYGFSEETGHADLERRRQRHAARHTRLRHPTDRNRHDGLQACRSISRLNAGSLLICRVTC
jgi:hypothetical protein